MRHKALRKWDILDCVQNVEPPEKSIRRPHPENVNEITAIPPVSRNAPIRALETDGGYTNHTIGLCRRRMRRPKMLENQDI